MHRMSGFATIIRLMPLSPGLRKKGVPNSPAPARIMPEQPFREGADTMQTSFSGFPAATFDFLSELAAHNSKDWFDANRDRYEAHWKGVGLDFIEAMAVALADIKPKLKAEARLNGSLRRINRDVRFSKDKSPYNARLHFIFWTGSHPNRSPGLHIVLHGDGIGYGAGVYGLEPAALKALRDRIVDPQDRAGLLQAIECAKSVQCDFDQPDLVNLPKGYNADGDWEHLLRRKALVLRTMQDLPRSDWISTSRAVDEFRDIARALTPLLAWLTP